MFNLTRHVRSALQPLLHRVLDLDPGERSAWLDELRADCPTVAREMERLMRSAAESSPTFSAYAHNVAVPGSPEYLGLRC